MRIGIIGRTAYGTDLCDGQTVKTRVLIDELKILYEHCDILIADTYGYKRHPIKMVASIINVMKNSDIVFVLLSRNGMKIIFPIVNKLNVFYKKPIFHDAIGGSLDKYAKNNPHFLKQLNSFTYNLVESKGLKGRLEQLGLKNVVYLPNFKRLVIKDKSAVELINPQIFKFCTFSRVNEAKGIGRACEAVNAINSECGEIKATLDIYGPIEENYDKTMNDYITKSKGAIRYMGVVKAKDSSIVLEGKYALLFPTMHIGEGFPGTFIDAFSAGVPVIATDWNLNAEIVKHGETGYLYSPKDPTGLIRFMRKLMENPEDRYHLSLNCIDEAWRYAPEEVMKIIDEKIQGCLQ